MNRSRLLATVSAAQMVFGVSGLAVALRRRHAFDIPGWKGSPDRVATDAAWMGTALSAPGPMLVAQAVATVMTARRPSRSARRVLGLLGGGMSIGYPIERLVRHRLTPAGWDPVESPLALGGWALAIAMAATSAAAE